MRGGFELCRRCGWEDDGQDDADADVRRGGPNPTSLTEARRLWAEQIEAGRRENEHPKGKVPPPPDVAQARRLWAEQIEAGRRENEQGDGP